MASSDRRSSSRVQVDIEVELRIGERVVRAPAENLSNGGVFLRLDDAPPLGTEIELTLTSAGRSARSLARVLHSASGGVGLTFVRPQGTFVEVAERLMAGASAAGTPVITRRMHERIEARVALIDARRERPYAVFTRDLSEGGAFLEAPPTEFLEDQLPLTLSEHGLFDCRVHVRFRSPEGIGVQFIDPLDEFEDAIGRILRAFLHKGPSPLGEP